MPHKRGAGLNSQSHASKCHLLGAYNGVLLFADIQILRQMQTARGITGHVDSRESLSMLVVAWGGCWRMVRMLGTCGLVRTLAAAAAAP